MIDKIVLKSEPITLLGGAEVRREEFERAISLAPACVAADGGAVHAQRFGHSIDAVIGDMDSLSGELMASLNRETIHHIREQDSTDFEKCLLRIESPLIVGLGFLGGRLDHQLAAFHALLRFAHQPCVLLGAEELVFLCPPEITLRLNAETPLSLFPLASVTGAATGLQWSFPSLDFAPGQRIGTSNMAMGTVTLEMSAAGMLCILPKSTFESVFSALSETSHLWPAHEE
ncbi:thiamine diphosphokinase [Planktotalea sp.]|uniref:thiamine diphosphokinase n=1 Tax=Planktotalea sp. TaxID=2029877 RepID=UPI003D6C3F52